MSVDVVGRWEDESVAAAPPIDAARRALRDAQDSIRDAASLASYIEEGNP